MHKPNYYQVLFITIILILSGNFQSCTNPNQEKELTKLQWLVGRWENNTENRKTIEIWRQNKSKGYHVTGFMLEGTDTIFSENITVKPVKNNIAYSVIIADQNEGKPVSFKLTENTGSVAKFENSEHDFPQKISYEKLSGDSVKVQVSGTMKGKPVLETYILKKQ